MTNLQQEYNWVVSVMQEFGWRPQGSLTKDVNWIKKNTPRFVQQKLIFYYTLQENK